MFTYGTGYYEYLKEKHGGINKDFWIDLFNHYIFII